MSEMTITRIARMVSTAYQILLFLNRSFITIFFNQYIKILTKLKIEYRQLFNPE